MSANEHLKQIVHHVATCRRKIKQDVVSVRPSKWIPSLNFSIIKFRGHLLARVAGILGIVASEGAREAVVIRVTVVFT